MFGKQHTEFNLIFCTNCWWNWMTFISPKPIHQRLFCLEHKVWWNRRLQCYFQSTKTLKEFTWISTIQFGIFRNSCCRNVDRRRITEAEMSNGGNRTWGRGHRDSMTTSHYVHLLVDVQRKTSGPATPWNVRKWRHFLGPHLKAIVSICLKTGLICLCPIVSVQGSCCNWKSLL